MRSDKAWFAPKRYGYGATPSTWQGWVATLVFVAAMALDMAYLRGATRWLGVSILILLFVGVCHIKSSAPWRWRWGDDRRSAG